MKKPKLISIAMPWSIAVDAEYLDVSLDSEGYPIFATFVACFTGHQPSDGPMVFSKPHEFLPAEPEHRSLYHMVKATFFNPMGYGWHEHDDRDDGIEFSEYDLSEYKGPYVREPVTNIHAFAEAYSEASREHFIRTGLVENSRVYEIGGSQALLELAGADTDLRHYLFVGSERNLSVIATGWKWEMGQPA